MLALAENRAKQSISRQRSTCSAFISTTERWTGQLERCTGGQNTLERSGELEVFPR